MPTRRRYFLGFCNFSLWSACSLTLGSIWVSTGLRPNNLASSEKSNTHFLRDKLIPFLVCATSIPNKYYKFPRSLVYNEIWRNPIISAIPFLSSPVIIISSILIFFKKNWEIRVSESLEYLTIPWVCAIPPPHTCYTEKSLGCLPKMPNRGFTRRTSWILWSLMNHQANNPLRFHQYKLLIRSSS